MKIKTIRAWGQQLALTKPYTIAIETITHAHLAFLEVELENGIIGFGSASPAEFVVGETTVKTLENLNSEFIQQLIGRDIRQFKQLIFECHRQYQNYPGTLAAIDIALHDTFGKYLDIPVVDFYGRKHNGLPTSVTIGIMDVARTISEALEYKQQGFRVLKVKTGLNVEEDIERIAKLKETFGGYFTIRVDANQGYNLKQTSQFMKATIPMGLELMEQPLPVGYEAEMEQLSPAEQLLCAGDESIKNSQAALKYASLGYFGIYNIKLMKCGGLIGAQTIAQIAEQAGISLFWGCNDESRLSITAALHIAYACPNTKYLDLDGSLDLIENLQEEGFLLKEGVMHIGTKSGFGCTPIR
jgi:L-alanine-DL-glutamate epimerase-like enolase superfamily enzyme